MRKLSVFEQVSLDGFFSTPDGDVSWTHRFGGDPEIRAMVDRNASSGGELLFGRKTYEMMASFWPTKMAHDQFPAVAKGMNDAKKLVASRTLREATWKNTRVLSDLVKDVRALKDGEGPPIAILGSGSVVSALARAKLLDEIQVLLMPTVLGKGRSLFDSTFDVTLTSSRVFPNGCVLLTYAP